MDGSPLHSYQWVMDRQLQYFNTDGVRQMARAECDYRQEENKRYERTVWKIK